VDEVATPETQCESISRVQDRPEVSTVGEHDFRPAQIVDLNSLLIGAEYPVDRVFADHSGGDLDPAVAARIRSACSGIRIGIPLGQATAEVDGHAGAGQQEAGADEDTQLRPPRTA
jgi:hypothetical protein